MSVLNLNKMFNPKSVALTGASASKDTLGYVLINTR